MLKTKTPKTEEARHSPYITVRLKLIAIIDTNKILLEWQKNGWSYVTEEVQCVHSRQEINKTVLNVLTKRFSVLVENLVEVESTMGSGIIEYTYVIHLRKKPMLNRKCKTFAMNRIPDGKTPFHPDIVHLITRFKKELR